MDFELYTMIPWGRSYEEYISMFNLEEKDLSGRILSCADGPSGFNKKMKELGHKVVSIDPFYSNTREQIEQKLEQAKEELADKIYKNLPNFVWSTFKTSGDLLKTRILAMKDFLSDFEDGKKEGRYLVHSLPRLPFKNNEFDLALCSHYLFLYSDLGAEFHVDSIMEMMRVAKEVRIFPLVDLNCNNSQLLLPVVQMLQDKGCMTEIVRTGYELWRNGREMLRVY